jgi:hypothetical protein
MAQLQGYLTRCDSDVITGTIWTFLERRGTVGICLIAPNPKLVPAVDGKVHWSTRGRVRPGISKLPDFADSFDFSEIAIGPCGNQVRAAATR